MPCERVDYYSEDEYQSALIAEEQAWEDYQQPQQEPNVVPCFKCSCQMYETSNIPEQNLCEECKLASDGMGYENT